MSLDAKDLCFVVAAREAEFAPASAKNFDVPEERSDTSFTQEPANTWSPDASCQKALSSDSSYVVDQYWSDRIRYGESVFQEMRRLKPLLPDVVSKTSPQAKYLAFRDAIIKALEKLRPLNSSKVLSLIHI